MRAHESYRDNCRLSVREVNFLVEAVRKRGAAAGLFGAKITGGGTGGTVAVFGKMEALKEHIPQIAVEYSRRVGVMPDIFEGTSPGAIEFGAHRYRFQRQRLARIRRVRAGGMSGTSTVRKAVIPVAGLGTRHFPASHAVKKELFPVVGPDGIARALFHYHLLELEAAGIEEICIIVQPGEEAMIRAYLQGPGDDYLKRLEKYPALFARSGGNAPACQTGAFRRADPAGRLRTRRFSDQEFCRRRNGPALPRRPSVSRQARLALPRTGAHGRSLRRQQCLRCQPHFGRRIERLWHHCRDAPRGKPALD